MRTSFIKLLNFALFAGSAVLGKSIYRRNESSVTIQEECKFLNSLLGQDENTNCCNDNIGVFCKDGHIYSIFITDKSLIKNTTMPSSFGPMKYVAYINLYELGLDGPIPEDIGELENLTSIDLDSNHLTGPIPSTIGKLKKLFNVLLHDNELSGPLPDTIGDMTVLFNFAAHNNKLTGNIPTTIKNLKNLNLVQLHNNKLVGEIPTSIIRSLKIRNMDLSDNPGLYGEYPGLGLTKTERYENTALCYDKNKLPEGQTVDDVKKLGIIYDCGKCIDDKGVIKTNGVCQCPVGMMGAGYVNDYVGCSETVIVKFGGSSKSGAISNSGFKSMITIGIIGLLIGIFHM